MHHFGKVLRAAAEFEAKVGLNLIEEISPGAGIEGRALHQGGLHRLRQKVALEGAYVLDPRPVLGDKRVTLVKRFQRFVAELHQLQFEKSEMLSAYGAQFTLKRGVLGLDHRIGQFRAFAQEQVGLELPA